MFSPVNQSTGSRAVIASHSSCWSGSSSSGGGGTLARNHGREQVIGGLPTRFHLRPCDCSVSREQVAAVQRTLADAILPALGLRTRDSPIYALYRRCRLCLPATCFEEGLWPKPSHQRIAIPSRPAPRNDERFQTVTPRPWPHACCPCGPRLCGPARCPNRSTGVAPETPPRHLRTAALIQSRDSSARLRIIGFLLDHLFA